jgi:hypothetical protein
MSFATEFASSETAASYDDWLRAKVAESMADPRPTVPHAVVMAEMDAIIAAAEARQRTKA